MGRAGAQRGSPAGAAAGLAAAAAFPGGRVRDAAPSPKPEPYRPAAIAAFWRCADMFAKCERYVYASPCGHAVLSTAVSTAVLSMRKTGSRHVYRPEWGELQHPTA